MKRGPLANLSMEFAVKISKLSDSLAEKREYTISRQIGKSGTSIGANIRESEFAQSKADFVSKLRIALKEAAETDFWLELLFRLDRLNQKDYDELSGICSQLIAMLTASVNTASNNASHENSN